jgi:IclR family mhp operon transcriptional activator
MLDTYSGTGPNSPPIGKSRRANARRGATDPSQTSYPPVEAARRVLEVLRVMNMLRIASVGDIYRATRLPKPTIVRLLETLMHDGYVARDNMCGGYYVTHRCRDLSAGSSGMSLVIEASRTSAISLTRRIKWPVGMAILDGDEIEIQYWTGSISPLAYRSTLLHVRSAAAYTAMGRAYLAFCRETEREQFFARMARKTAAERGDFDAADFRRQLARIRETGHATRDARVAPFNMNTVGMAVRLDGCAVAAASVTFYKSVVAPSDIAREIIEPLREMVLNVEDTLAHMRHISTAAADAGLAAGPEGAT